MDRKKAMTCRRYQKLTQYLHVSDWANEPAQNSVDYENCTRFVHCSTWYETALLSATSLDKIKQLMKAWLPLRVDIVMYNIYLPNQSRKELRCGCVMILIQHICIDLRCILVNSTTLSLALDMMWWWNYVRIYQEKIVMSIVTPCLHLSSYWGTCWLVKHAVMGQYK